MKKIAALLFLLTMPLACSKPDAAPAEGSTPPKGGAAEAPKTATAAPAKAAFVQKGIKPGKVVVGYIVDTTDPSQCSAVTDDPAGKEEFTKNAEKFAQMVKGKVVASCPTDNVVGTCDAGMGMLVNYSGPKWTKESAQKNCVAQPRAAWLD